jgi:hypothetical protein
MAGEVGTMWMVANGARSPVVPPLVDSLRAAGQDVRVASGDVGLGWAEAIRASL